MQGIRAPDLNGAGLSGVGETAGIEHSPTWGRSRTNGIWVAAAGGTAAFLLAVDLEVLASGEVVTVDLWARGIWSRGT